MGQWAVSLPVTLCGALRVSRQWQVQVCARGLCLPGSVSVPLGSELQV